MSRASVESFSGKTIVVGVTASIAAYKTLDVIKKLRQQGATVYVIMTKHATRLVDPQEFAKASGQPVRLWLFPPDTDYRKFLAKDEPIEHISLADEADLFLICPATANVIGKVAAGIADDLLTTSIMATEAAVIFAPAMNVKMWKNPATQDNVRRLKKRGFYFIKPEIGELACGYQGIGRLANPNRIIAIIQSILNRRSQLAGRKVVVTAGATREPLDAVRILTNPATGKMGRALAETAYWRGAEVVFIRSESAVEPRCYLKELLFRQGKDLWQILKEEVKNADIVIHTAAVTDFLPQRKVNSKRKSSQEWQLRLKPASKIINHLRKINKKAFIVGFKAEYKISKKELIDRAYQMLLRSGIDLVVANDVGRKKRGFAVDTNEVFIIDKKKNITHLPLAAKEKIAEGLWNQIETSFISKLN